MEYHSKFVIRKCWANLEDEVDKFLRESVLPKISIVFTHSMVKIVMGQIILPQKHSWWKVCNKSPTNYTWRCHVASFFKLRFCLLQAHLKYQTKQSSCQAGPRPSPVGTTVPLPLGKSIEKLSYMWTGDLVFLYEIIVQSLKWSEKTFTVERIFFSVTFFLHLQIFALSSSVLFGFITWLSKIMTLFNG